MELRKTILADLPALCEIYALAKESMKARGIDQWQDGYPNGDSAAADIAAGISYVLTEHGRVIATACLDFGHEPTYGVVYDGAWKGRGAYGFLHRVAVAPASKGKGAAGIFFRELERQAGERGVKILRGDTHRDNLPMRHTMEKNGFEERGTILLEDKSSRIAYEKLL